MTVDDACKWLNNLRNDMGNPHYECLWVYAQAIDEIILMLEEQPPIVQCKDCEFGTICNNGVAYVCEKCIGTQESIIHPLNWFCASGIRKGERRY